MVNKIKDLVNQFNGNSYYYRENIFKEKYPEEYNFIIEYTKDLNINKFSQKIWHTINQIDYIPKCKTCNKDLNFIKINTGYGQYCSINCMNTNIDLINNKSINRQNTNEEKYGYKFQSQRPEIKDNLKKQSIERYPKIKDKIEQTNLKKRGVKQVFQDKTVRDKCIETMLKTYGVENIFQLDSIIKKRKEKSFEKLGFEYALQNRDILNKAQNNLELKIGVKHGLQNSIINEKAQESIFNKYLIKIENKINKLGYKFIKYDNTIITAYCNKCKKEFEIQLSVFYKRIEYKIEICTQCTPLNHQQSQAEYDIIDFLYQNNIINIEETNKTILNGKHIDIYLPDYKIGIEYNGLIFHSSKYKYNKYYHQNKSKLAKEKNIQLIHIWADDWTYKNDIIKSMLLNKLGKSPNKIYARKTIIKEVNNIDSKIFLNKNHLQGSGKNAKINLGLYYNNELVSLMTFGKSSYYKKIYYEMYRFCNKLNTNVIGGASKLFKYFINNYKIDCDIISFANFDHSNGNLYEKLNFKFISITEPSYSYLINKIRIDRQLYMKHKLIEQGFDPELSEKKIMEQRGYYQIYNAGNLKYIYEIK